MYKVGKTTKEKWAFYKSEPINKLVNFLNN